MMRVLRRLRRAFAATSMLIAATTFMVAAQTAFSQNAVNQIDGGTRPTNSHATPYGDNWNCDWGYERTDDRCSAIAVPVNAFLDGSKWRCDRGFYENDGKCLPVQLPDNAHATDSPYGLTFGCAECGTLR